MAKGKYSMRKSGTGSKTVWRVFQVSRTFGSVLKQQFRTKKAATAYIRSKGG